MSSACFSTAANCVLDWDGINAVATSIAILVALASAGLAVWTPRRAKVTERSDTTNEILSAAGDAIDLFRLAEGLFGKSVMPMADVVRYGAKASYTRTALARLSERTELTDGAIFVAGGAMELLKAVEDEVLKYKALRGTPFAPMIVSDLPHLIAVQPILLQRAQDVAAYAMKRKWPKCHERFSAIATGGLRS